MAARPWTCLQSGPTVTFVTDLSTLVSALPNAVGLGWVVVALRAVWLLPDWIAKWRTVAPRGGRIENVDPADRLTGDGSRPRAQSVEVPLTDQGADVEGEHQRSRL